VGLVELVKFGGLPHRWGLLVAGVLSALAVWVEIQVAGYQSALLREYISGWAAILFSAAGVYGFVRSTHSSEVTDGRRPD
jgi:hypothetical protein